MHTHKNFIGYLNRRGLGQDYLDEFRKFFRPKFDECDRKVKQWLKARGFSYNHEFFLNPELKLVVKKSYHLGPIEIDDKFTLPYADLSSPDYNGWDFNGEEYRIWRMQCFSPRAKDLDNLDYDEWNEMEVVARKLRRTAGLCGCDNQDIYARNITRWRGKWVALDW